MNLLLTVSLFKTDRWIIYTTLSNLIDISIVALAIALVYNLEMKPSRKTKIVVIFALRLGYVIPSIFGFKTSATEKIQQQQLTLPQLNPHLNPPSNQPFPRPPPPNHLQLLPRPHRSPHPSRNDLQHPLRHPPLPLVLPHIRPYRSTRTRRNRQNGQHIRQRVAVTTDRREWREKQKPTIRR
jgi:hypothetical protein